jgi:hypothetical protein
VKKPCYGWLIAASAMVTLLITSGLAIRDSLTFAIAGMMGPAAGTRVGPWLPWMRMDGHEGIMVYHARSRRLGGWEELPGWIRERVLAQHAAYRHAPETVDPSVRNETSWTFYMKEMKRRAGSDR